jgi:Flp pilus assembly protein TadD
VSVSDLEAPKRARKEVEKAYQSFARQNWMQARDRLNKAISFYPAYAGAYNDLAVAYAQLGDVEEERQALEKAIALDDHYTLAELNLGRMNIQEGKLPEAEAALHRAAALAPEDPRAFILLAYCQFLQKHFDDVIATSHEAHKLSAGHAFVHRVAARAFEQKRQFNLAAAELNPFLQEQPAGPAADAARKELEIVESAQGK